MSRVLASSCVLVLLTASPSSSQDVVIKMGTLLSAPRPGHTPHHMVSIQDYLAKRIRLHTNGEVELDVLEGDEARVPVAGTSQGDFPFIPVWLGGELAAANNVVNAASLPPFIYDTPELMVTAIPYLFSGMEHTRRYPGSAAAERVAEAFARDYPGARLMGNFLIAVDMSVNTRGRFFTELKDFEGVIIQDFDPYWKEMWVNHMPAEFASCGFGCAAAGNLLGDGWRTMVNADRSGTRLPLGIRETEFAAMTFTTVALREHYALQQERGVRMRIQTPAERETWKAELRPKVEAIYRGHVGDGADAILADVAALDDRFGEPETAPVILNMASLINQPGPPTAESHHMSFTHARLKQLIHAYTDGEVALHEMSSEEQNAQGWFAPFPILNGVSAGDADAANMPSFFFLPAPFPPFNITNGGYLVDVQSQAYVFEDVEHFRRFLGSDVEATISAEIETAFPGLEVLGYFSIGSDVAINSDVGPISQPTDVCGHRITPGFDSWKRLFDAACADAGLDPVVDLSDQIDTDGAFNGAHLRERNEINIGMFQNGYGQSLGQWGDVTYIPNLYNIFYTFTVNEEVWNGLTPESRRGIERAIAEVQQSAFAYQIDGLLAKQGLMQDQGADVHYQTKAEKAVWRAFLAPSVDAWVSDAPDPGEARALLAAIARLGQDTKRYPALPVATGALESEYVVR